jgi:hypothetical protein
MPLQATSGAASYDAFGGGAAAVPNYIEEVFSTYLYTGNGSTQTITNGIDLAGKGGLVWTKCRSNVGNNVISDSARGGNNRLFPNLSAAADAFGATTFLSNGFSLDDGGSDRNTNLRTYASWTFRKQPKFFDVVTYTGNGAARTIAHNLGSVPGCIIVKQTSASSNWMVYHRGLTSAQYVLNLNNTGPQSAQTSVWNSTNPTSTVFSVGADLAVNDTGQTYVAYLFAHNAGGFGLTGTDNVISCGSYTGNGSATGPVVTLGYEPQWLMIKNASGTDNWQMLDNMRGMPVGSADATLQANVAIAETSVEYVSPTATGFQITSTRSEVNTNTNTYIYIAIRRGPMKVPTDGTKVFAPFARTGSESTTVDNVGFPADAIFIKNRFDAGYSWRDYDRLRGGYYLAFNNTDVEAVTGSYASLLWSTNQNSVSIGTGWSETNYSGGFFADYVFRRAPGFFDVVCYTGTGSARTVAHNLTVAPELMIVKQRNTANDWPVYAAPRGNNKVSYLNFPDAEVTRSEWNNTTPTASVFSVNSSAAVNQSGSTYVAYLFATCAGVSKVGSYTGNGLSQTINCGFTGGARFVLIKRTDSTGDWYVYDTARGMAITPDPYLLLNSTAAETATTASVLTSTGGFVIIGTPPAVNTSGASYIFLAIA